LVTFEYFGIRLRESIFVTKILVYDGEEDGFRTDGKGNFWF